MSDTPPSPTIPLHDFLGFEYGLSDGKQAVVRLPVTPNALGHTGNLHGGALATLVDLCCAVAAVQAVGFDPLKESLVTSDMHVRYVGRPRTSGVLAKAEVIRAGSQIIVIECKIVDDDDHLVATADMSMMRVTVRDPLEI